MNAKIKDIMQPSNDTRWGSHAWKFMHFAGFAYPVDPTPQQRAGAKRWLIELKHILPCERCRNHWAKYVDEHEPDTSSRESLSRYLWRAHNAVNLRLNKPEYPYSRVVNEYSPERRKTREMIRAAKHIGLTVAGVTLLIIVIVFLERYCYCPKK